MSKSTTNAILTQRLSELPTMLGESSSFIKSLDYSQAGQSHADVGDELLDILKQARDSDDLDIMLDVETSFVVNQVSVAIERNEHWPDEMNSVISCENQLAQGLEVYDNLKRDPKKYQEIARVYVDHAKNDHYPNDPFRKFLDGQHARLRNSLKDPRNDTEKQILEARDANVKAMRRLYKHLQIDLLPPPNRGIGALNGYLNIREHMTQEAQPDKQINQGKDEDRSR